MTLTPHLYPVGSQEFMVNFQAQQALVDHLKQTTDHIKLGGTKATRSRHQERGRLLVRERLAVVLDAGADFLELSALAGYALYPDIDLPAGGIITGIGPVMGRLCMIIANDPTVKAGTYFPITVKKHLRAQEIARQNRLPCLYLVDSGGAYLPMQDEVFPDKDHFGRFFYNQARMSAEGIPQLAVVLGSCTAGGAYIPAMADQTIMVREQSSIFLGGPALVKAATGEDVTAEALGGADLHCTQSGVADYLAQDERHALRILRDLVSDLPITPRASPQIAQEPTLPPQDIYGFIAQDLKHPFDMQGILACLVDHESWHPFKETFGPTLICGFAHIGGYQVGILANEGVLFSEAALKGTHFIELCCQRNIPLLFLQNIMGFMVGQHAEAQGIAKHGAKLVAAVASANVPKLTIVMGGSYGAGNYGMCGRAFDPRFMFMWPNARLSVMGGEQAATVLSLLRQEAATAQGHPLTHQELETFKAPLRQQYDHCGHPYYTAARLWDDGVIDPAATRRIVIQCLDIVRHAPPQPTSFGVFRM